MNKAIDILKKIPGYKSWCPACNHELGASSICAKFDTTIEKCPNKAKHIGRVVVYEPNSKKRRVKIIHETDPELIRKTIALFRYDVKNEIREEKTVSPTNQDEIKKEFTFMQCATFFAAYLDLRRGGAHTQRNRTSGHKKDLMRTIILFAKAMQKKGINSDKIKISEITQEHVGIYHQFLLERKKYSGRTYNRRMENMKQFFNYLKTHEQLEIINQFDTVKKRPTHTDIRTVESKHFLRLLEIITPENGIQVLKTGEKKRHYFSFLKNAYLIALLTGLRREQLVNLNFKNIKENEQGIPEVIISDNLKVNRIMGIENSGNKRITTTPVSPQLLQLLLGELDYNANKNSDRFLIAGDSQLKRKTIMTILSKSFSHYWNQLGDDVPKEVSFTNLRKAFATSITLALGDNAKHITDHTNQEILNRHYINKETIARNASKHNLFPDLDLNELKRKEELNQVRTQQQQDISKKQGINK